MGDCVLGSIRIHTRVIFDVLYLITFAGTIRLSAAVVNMDVSAH